MVNSILSGLNDSQQEAVLYEDGPLLILAGAGSGKTRVLTHRIAHFLSRGIPSYNILGVTFTNKAAGEMRERVHKLTQRQVWISTFHAICLKILRQDGEAIGLKRDFTIYDDQDQLVVIKECLAELRYDEKQVNPKAVREAISRAKDFLKTPQELGRMVGDYFDELVAKVYERYEKKLLTFQAVDFGDLIMKTVQLFERNEPVLETYQERFKYILIDEYQDTNHAQYRFVANLAKKYLQITVVGDPDQSIYSWRGADIANILNFERDYPAAKWIKLEQNYRSTTTILQAANALIQRNTQRKHKELWSARGQGEKISLFEAGDEREEALYVVNQLSNYQSQGMKLQDMVVFYRVHAQSRVIEDTLRKYKIAYRIVGGIRFYDRKEIKDLMAYLKVIVFPQDEVSLKRILNVPARGIGKKTIELLEKFREERGGTLLEAVGHADEIKEIGPKVKQALKGFSRYLETLKDKKNDAFPSELLKEILERTGYLDELQKERSLESQSRIENIKEFIGVAYEFEENVQEEDKNRMVENFIESICLQGGIDGWNSEENTLTMMSLHTAKGLEFPIVFVIGMEEEIFPHVNSMGGSTAELEEERRLCYVGMTRAKEKLHLIYASSRKLYGFRNFNLPSRFLNEIPGELYEHVGSNALTRNSSLEEEDVLIEFDGEDDDTLN